MIQFGDQYWGAKVKVVQEQGGYRIDEIHLIAGQNEGFDLKIAARDQLNNHGRYLRSRYPLIGVPFDQDTASRAPAEILTDSSTKLLEENQFAEQPAYNSLPKHEQRQPIDQLGGWDDFEEQDDSDSANEFEFQPPQSNQLQPQSGEYRTVPAEFPPLEDYPGK
ncbi:MAG: hypothetical protein R3C11_21220 [Planctomycetaceae bacterium]